VTVLGEFEAAPLPVNLLYTAGRFLPIKLRAFLDFAAPRLKLELSKSVAVNPVDRPWRPYDALKADLISKASVA
jgi:hypothetical protein